MLYNIIDLFQSLYSVKKKLRYTFKDKQKTLPYSYMYFQFCFKNSFIYFYYLSEESRIPWFGIAAGFVLGLVIVIADETIAEKSVLEFALVKLLVIAATTGLGYGIALAYR